ncbi:MAG: TonB-dependent receptor plug domain-containing protein [Crocinitomicaceae bacterium]
MLNRFPFFLLLSAIYCFQANVSFSQEVAVRDKITQQFVLDAKIISNDPKVQKRVDLNGRFKLEPFKGCDSIFITADDYQTIVTSYSEIKKMGIVEMVDEPLSFTDIIISVNRWDEEQLKVPNRITSIDMKEAELLGPQTSADLLETSGYVFIQKSQLAGGSPQLRGFGTNRVLIAVDGVRMNNAIFRSGNLQNVISLDANSLESVEVLFGPGAVIYGSDAIGGVMNFSTKEAQFSPDSVNTFLPTHFAGRYSSASNEVMTHVDFNIGKKKWAFLTSLTFSRYGDLRTGKNGNSAFLRPTYQQRINGVDSTLVNDDPTLQLHSGFSQINAIQKIKYQASENWLLDYSFIYSTTTDAPRYDRLALDREEDGILDNAEWYYGPQKWMMHKFGATHSRKSGVYNDLRITAAYQNFQESRHDRKTGNSLIRRQFENVDAFSLNVDLDKKVGKRFTLFYGLESIGNVVGSNAYTEDIDTKEQLTINSRYPNESTWFSSGAYVNGKYSLNETWSLNGGLRYSFYSISAEFDTSLFPFPVTQTTNSNGALNGSLGLVFNPSDHFQIYSNFATGFRAPNIDDLGKVFDSEPGSVVIPNVNLRPEYVYNGELGFVAAVAARVKIDGVAYYTYLQDALARADFSFNGQDSIFYQGEMSRVQAVQNVSDAWVYGVQAGIEVVLTKGLSLRSTISFQKGEEFNIEDSAYYPKSHVAPTFGRTSITYKRRQLKLDVYSNYQMRLDPEDLPFDEPTFLYALNDDGQAFVPSWYTLNVKAAVFFNKHLSISGGIENITNQLYRTARSGISAPGRNFVLGLKVTL